MGEVNRAMSEVWVEELMGDMWDLNCLVYSGALVAMRLGEEEANKGAEVLVTEGEEDEEDADEMEVERALGEEQDPRRGNPKPQTIADLRQVIGWLECEIQRKKRGSNRLTLKEGLRLKKLQKQLGGN